MKQRSHSMRSGLEKRLSRLERIVAARTKTSSICNCRVETRFHNADCLDAILKGIPRVCSVHGGRELGFFFWTSQHTAFEKRTIRFVHVRHIPGGRSCLAKDLTLGSRVMPPKKPGRFSQIPHSICSKTNAAQTWSWSNTRRAGRHGWVYREGNCQVDAKF